MALFLYVIKIIEYFVIISVSQKKPPTNPQPNKPTQTKPQTSWIYDSQSILQQYPRPESRHGISQTSHLFWVLSPADLAQLTSYRLHQLQT